MRRRVTIISLLVILAALTIYCRTQRTPDYITGVNQEDIIYFSVETSLGTKISIFDDCVTLNKSDSQHIIDFDLKNKVFDFVRTMDINYRNKASVVSHFDYQVRVGLSEDNQYKYISALLSDNKEQGNIIAKLPDYDESIVVNDFDAKLLSDIILRMESSSYKGISVDHSKCTVTAND